MTTTTRPVLVDANVVVYAFDVTEAPKQAVAVDALGRLSRSNRGRLSVQVLGESYRAMTRKLKPPLSEEDAAEVVLALSRAWPVFDLTAELVPEAMRGSRVYQMSYWDGLIWAVAKAHGVDIILTEDRQNGRTIEGVTTVNPFAPDFDLSTLD